MPSSKRPVTEQVEALARPIAEQLGLTLWDIEFVKEGASWFLRIFIDKEGGISIDDCEAFSKKIDGPLDEADPIEQAYYLEVSSPGIERELRRDWHFADSIGKEVKVRLIRPDAAGARELSGMLSAYEAGVLTLETSAGSRHVNKSDASHVKLSDTDDLM